MRFSTTLAVASTASMAAAHPFRNSRRGVTAIPETEKFDILLAGSIDGKVDTVAQSVSTIILDMQNTQASTIAELKAAGKKVICYFSAGSYEDGRDDSAQFKPEDKGNKMDGWPEYWVDVKSENVRKIMVGRLKKAAEKGCLGVDPDNTDGYQKDNNDGFGYDPSVHAEYVKFLAGEAAKISLAIGLKNSLELVPSVIDSVQFAVNEQCVQYGECDKLKPFTDAGKAVFNIEYPEDGGSCGTTAGVKMSSVEKSLDLNSLGGACGGSSDPPAQPPTRTTTKPVPEPTTKAPTSTSTGTATQPLPTITGTTSAQPTASKPSTSKTATAAPKPSTTSPTLVQPSPTQTSVSKPTPTKTTPSPPKTSKPPVDDDDEEDDEDDGDDEEDEEYRWPWYGYWGRKHRGNNHHGW